VAAAYLRTILRSRGEPRVQTQDGEREDWEGGSRCTWRGKWGLVFGVAMGLGRKRKKREEGEKASRKKDVKDGNG
jgi:hypothetical protein